MKEVLQQQQQQLLEPGSATLENNNENDDAIDEKTVVNNNNINNNHNQSTTTTNTTATTDIGDDVKGVLFSRSVRSTFASLTLAAAAAAADDVDTSDRLQKNDDGDDDDDEQQPPLPPRNSVILVRIQFSNDNHREALRSYCRRMFKIGDLIYIPKSMTTTTTTTTTTTSTTTTEWTVPRIILNCNSMDDVSSSVMVKQSRAWTMPKCQIWQNRFFPKKKTKDNQNKRAKQKQKNNNNNVLSAKGGEQGDGHHGGGGSTGGGLGKRLQGQHIAEFLINAMVQKLQTQNNNNNNNNINNNDNEKDKGDNKNNNKNDDEQFWRNKAIDMLNQGSGVVDVAGGSGHVSMALGMLGVKSTVVDAREGVGKLPGRDRKIWNRALKKKTTMTTAASKAVVVEEDYTKHKAHSPSSLLLLNNNNNNNNNYSYCHPVVPFQTYRSWFGVSRPLGVDATFRHPDEDALPVCNYESSDSIVRHASAIVALHPDEATADVVQIAVQHSIPFVVVPCCVFARLFPNRKINVIVKNENDNNNNDTSTQQQQQQQQYPQQKKSVTTYEDLLEYLLQQHDSIQKKALPFEGKNIVLWSTF